MGAPDPFELLISERDLEPRAGTFPSGNGWRGIYSRQCDPASSDPVYRYAFGEWWGEQSFNNTAVWVLLNPSTGDTDGQPRPVLGYCRNRSMDWGHTGIVIVNLFAYRARDPKRLRRLDAEEAQGPDNDRALELITAACGRTIAAWGNGGTLADRGETVRRVLSEPYCLVKNEQVLSGKGQPFFPRGLSTDARLAPLPSAERTLHGSTSSSAAGVAGVDGDHQARVVRKRGAGSAAMPERPLKINPQQVGQAGEHFVAAELHRRGAYAVTFSGNMPNIDILASDVDQARTFSIQVKTKTTGTWHTTITRGEPREENPDEDRFWVLVDIGRDPDARPDYYVVPEWWMANHIHTRYQKKPRGAHSKNPDSKHFAILPKAVAEWRERWDLLGL